MRVKVRLLPHHQKVLEALRDVTLPHGEHCLGFNAIAHLAEMDRAEVRRIVRHLARRGLAEYHRGLWTYDGQMAGSGYCITHAGIALLAERLVENDDG